MLQRLEIPVHREFTCD